MAAGAFLLLASCKHATTEKETLPNATEAIPVKIAEVKNENFSREITATGLLTTENEAKLSFKIGGVIDKILVNEGQFFTKGQLLATLKITEINAQEQQAVYALDKAKRDYGRVSDLFKDSVATLEQLQNTQTALDMAQKTLDLASFNRKYASIYATEDGFVNKKMGNEGEIIGPGTPVLTINEIVGSADWILKVGVTDEEWGNIAVNQKATIVFDAFPNKTFNAYVFRKSQAADQAGGSFQIELKVKFENEKPAIGMFGKAAIHMAGEGTAVVIPYEALVQADGSKGFVFVPQQDNSVKKKEVIIQSFNENKVVIQSGVDPGDKVIISNNAFLNEQSKISIAE